MRISETSRPFAERLRLDGRHARGRSGGRPRTRRNAPQKIGRHEAFAALHKPRQQADDKERNQRQYYTNQRHQVMSGHTRASPRLSLGYRSAQCAVSQRVVRTGKGCKSNK